MKKIVCILSMLLAGVAVSCQRETPQLLPVDDSPAPQEIRLVLSPTPADETKSQYAESALKTIRNIWLIGVYEDGFWQSAYFTESALTRSGTALQCPPLSFRSGSRLRLYVAANVGDLTEAAAPQGYPAVDALEYLLPSQVDFSTAGMPMAAQLEVLLPAGNQVTTIPVSLVPLLARLKMSINKNGISNHVMAHVIASGSLKIKQANRRLRPFGASSARSTDDLFSIDIDQEAFATAVRYDMIHSDIVLYVPENVHGDLLEDGSSQWDKGNRAVPGKELCTYIEYACSKNAENDGVGGALTYKAYLGEDATQNFSVSRNTTYHCTLDLTWNGLFFEGDWRVNNSDISDGRILTLSGTPHTPSVAYTDMGSLGRNRETTLYVNFSRDGGASWIHSAKDIASWPYGWELYVDGVKQSAGNAASAAGDLDWTYTGAASGDRIGIRPGDQSVTGTRHTLQVKSTDGRISSNVVSFEVGDNPLVGKWLGNTVPLYVAQRGQIRCFEPDSDQLYIDAEVYATDPSKITVRPNGDGTADISILAPFEAGEAGIYLVDPDGERRCDITLEGRLPYWCLSSPGGVTTYVDGAFSKHVSLSATAATQGAELLQNRFTMTRDTYATGRKLNYNLVLSCLKPGVTSDNALVGLKELQYAEDGVNVVMQLKTFNGLSFGSGTEKGIDTSHIGFQTFGATRSDLDVPISAINPFQDYSGLRAGSLMDDYTLYQFPDNDYEWDGTQRWSASSYSDSRRYTMTVPRIVVEDASHTRLKAYFHDDGRAFGTAMLSGAPRTDTYTSMTYSLSGLKKMDILSHGAGRVDFNVDIVNPVDKSVLTKTFGYGYVRLHAFIYGEVYWRRNGTFVTAPNILHGNAVAGGKGLFPTVVNFNYVPSLSAPTWPYISTQNVSNEEDDYLIRALMENDTQGGRLACYPELESVWPVWVGDNGHGEEDVWCLPEALRLVAENKQAEFLKACVRRAEVPYTFSDSYTHTSFKNAGFYRPSPRELHYDPTWATTKTYTDSGNNRLLVLHIVEGITETNHSFLGYYQAAPENGNAGWYFSYQNRTAFWR